MCIEKIRRKQDFFYCREKELNRYVKDNVSTINNQTTNKIMHFFLCCMIIRD